ncbi:MAG: tRNA (N(6)-L-threonylcarbamoyladenosine(37)-C(2))-methylthiotransferase MtaB [Candidatus Omnitrophota bacterium]
MPAFRIATLGCKVNQYETQAVREQLLGAGLKEAGRRLPADIYVINTCTVTQKADSESLNLIRRSVRENPKAKIYVTGCLAELDAPRIRGLKGAIKIVKNRSKGALAGYILGRKQRLFSPGGISYFKGHNRAFLKIQDGCNNRCSYCKVRLARGQSRSRGKEDVVAEARRLTHRGIKEIVLCGICLGAYGKDLKPRSSLAALLGELEGIRGLRRIRLSSIEAADISEELIARISVSSKICRHLHVPIQSGDDDILRKMGRRYRRRYYLDLIRSIKSNLAGVSVTTDVLAGFPGEKAVNFNNTVSLIRKIKPLKVHIFPYSRREGTPAANFKSRISAGELSARMAQLRKVSYESSLSYRRGFLGKRVEVLVEGRAGIGGCLFWQGYSGNYMRVLLKSAANLRNKVVMVRIKKIFPDYALADVCPPLRSVFSSGHPRNQ